MDNKSKIASCNICLLADAMKVCQLCPLNPAHLKLTPDEKSQVTRQELFKDQRSMPS
jgi:hypothetical protein